MKAFAAAAMLLVLGTVGAQAQHRGGGGGHRGFVAVQPHPGFPGGFRNYGSTTGFGNVLAPGTGNLPPLVNPWGKFATFPQRFGATVSGFPGYPGVRGGKHGGFAGGYGSYAVPVPVYVGGDPYGYGYQQPEQQPNITIVMPPTQPAPAAPPVTIQQYFGEGAQPVMREYGPDGEEIKTYRAPAAERPAPPEDEVMFLLPLRDNSVYSAKAYWVEGEMLHYITTQGRHNQVSIDLVDRELADRLNKGRQIEFRLPPVKTR